MHYRIRQITLSDRFYYSQFIKEETYLERVSAQPRIIQLIRNRGKSPNPHSMTPKLRRLRDTLSFRTDVCKREALGARSFWKENVNLHKVHLQWFLAFVAL